MPRVGGRNKRLLHWQYFIDWLTDSVSHETLHDVVKRKAGLKACRMLDRLRVSMWCDVPDRAGLHFKPEFLKRLDYDNRYSPLGDI